MASIQELISETMAIKHSSEELSNMTASAGNELLEKSKRIGVIVRGSRSGQDAVMAVSTASRALLEAAASMRTLSGICEKCAANLAK